ncbi:hypothetical protein [Methanopyrus sp.]
MGRPVGPGSSSQDGFSSDPIMHKSENADKLVLELKWWRFHCTLRSCQLCSEKPQEGCRSRGLFVCPYCGVAMRADVTVAFNVTERGSERVQAED